MHSASWDWEVWIVAHSPQAELWAPFRTCGCAAIISRYHIVWELKVCCQDISYMTTNAIYGVDSNFLLLLRFICIAKPLVDIWFDTFTRATKVTRWCACEPNPRCRKEFPSSSKVRWHCLKSQSHPVVLRYGIKFVVYVWSYKEGLCKDFGRILSLVWMKDLALPICN